MFGHLEVKSTVFDQKIVILPVEGSGIERPMVRLFESRDPVRVLSHREEDTDHLHSFQCLLIKLVSIIVVSLNLTE